MSKSLAATLRLVAARLAGGAPYQWGHMGQCNCGHLAQVVTTRTAAEIHASAMRRQTGEWTEYANDYCGATGTLIDDVFEDVLAAGFTREDMAHAENLDDPRVIARLGRRPARNVREDAIAYFLAWADVVDAAAAVDVPAVDVVAVVDRAVARAA
jgi:hypothetical protein